MEDSVPKEVKAPCKICNKQEIYFTRGGKQILISSGKQRMHKGKNLILFHGTMIVYPEKPSAAYILGNPSSKPFANVGCVCTRIFTDSNGQRPTSAMIWAEALLRKYIVLLLLSTSMSEYHFLKYS
jgi:hypothetical protein